MNELSTMSGRLSAAPPVPDDPSRGGLEIDLVAIWSAFLRHRILFLATIAVFMVIGVIYLLLATPIYKATASVQIEERSSRVLEQQLDPTSSTSDAERFLTTQLDVLKSRSLALSVAQDLNLIGNPRFLTAMGLSPDVKPVGVLNQRDSEREVVLGVLRDNLTVNLPTDSRLVDIEFSSPDPALAARIANSYADNYIRLNLQRKYDTSAYAREFLAKQLDEAKRQLELSERAALAYARQARLIDASNAAASETGGSGPKSLTIARLVRLNQAYSEAVSVRIAAQEKWELSSRANLLDLPEVLGNPAIQQLLQKRAEQNAEFEDQRQARREDYPTVKQAKARLDELDRQVKAIASSIRTSIKANYDLAVKQEDEIRRDIGGLEGETLAEQNRNVQMSILQRATDTNRTLYDSLLQRYRQLSAEAGIQPNNIQVVDRADVPAKPIWPRALIVLFLAGLAGAVVAVILILGREHLDDTIRSGEELNSKLGLPLLGTVPIADNGDVMGELADPKSSISEAFNSIRASLLLSTPNGLPKTLLFTSTQASEGKTTTVFAVGSGLAKIGKRVVIIDLDMRRPAQAKNFGLGNAKGASDVFAHTLTLDQVIQQTSVPGVSLVSSGSIPPNPTELLSSPQLRQMLDHLAAKFDIVIVDAPPILGLADAILLGSSVQSAVLVVESGRTYRGGSKAAVARMQKAGAHFIGAILTKQDIRNTSYGYDYTYQYRYDDGMRPSK